MRVMFCHVRELYSFDERNEAKCGVNTESRGFALSTRAEQDADLRSAEMNGMHRQAFVVVSVYLFGENDDSCGELGAGIVISTALGKDPRRP